MEIYINAVSNISPQNTFDESKFLEEIIEDTRPYLQCIQPDYKSYIDVKATRRMGRILKMGVTAALKCLKDSQVSVPDAIISGTGFGCLEDTVNFLNSIIENKEQLLTPTSFIQSTHNTLSAQIALLLNCNNYNFTYVHRGFSFESALLDAMLNIEEGSCKNVLVGAADEIVEEFFHITGRLGQWKQKGIRNVDLLADKSSGSIAGEGSTFFLLSSAQEEGCYCKITKASTFYNPTISGLSSIIENFLEVAGLTLSNVDLIILGNNGDEAGDKIYEDLTSSYLANNNLAYFKHLCGEYYTASAFATWLGAKIIKHQTVPPVIKLNAFDSREFKNILIYNHYAIKNHSLILLSQC